MVASRVPGPLRAGSEDPSHSRLGSFTGSAPGPVGVAGDAGLAVIETVKTAHSSSAPVPPQPFSELDSKVVNAAAFTARSMSKAEEGVRLVAIRLLPAGTMLYRIGSTKKFGASLPADANFASPWWLRKSEFDRILEKGLQDTAWAARVLPAIASAWGTECDLQICVKTATDLYAWIGEGKAIDFQGRAVEDSHSDAYWFPEKDLLQLYVPGLAELNTSRTPLWQTALTDRSIDAWLPIGTQRNVATGKPFIPRSESANALRPGKR